MKHAFPSDDVLLAAARSGSTAAFEALAERYRSALTGYAYRLLRDRDEACDVAQEALFRAYRHLDQFARDRSFRNWLFVIARHLAYDASNKRERLSLYAVPDERVPARTPGPEELTLQDETKHHVRRAIGALPGRYREPLELYYVSGLLYREIADLLGLPIGTVKTNIARAKQRLRAELANVPLQRIA